MNNLSDLKKLLSPSAKVVITMHQRPDADALGSSLGLKHFFSQLSIESAVVAPTVYPSFLNWMPGNDDVIIYSHQNQEPVATLFDEADVVFCLDFSTRDRVGTMSHILRKVDCPIVLIDHHREPESFAQYELWDPTASATAELIHDFISLYDKVELVNQDIAECLYAGIMTDTGSFRFPSTSPKVHRILAQLMETGIDHSRIHRRIYDDNRPERLKFLGHTLLHCLEIIPEYHCAIIGLDQNTISQFDIQTGDTEGLVNYALSVSGTVFAILVKDDSTLRKMSFRSVGSFAVNEFSRDHFSGGGHKNAAGGRSDESFTATVKKIKRLLPEYKDQLIKSSREL